MRTIIMDAERVRAQLDRILASAAFAEADRAGRFLRFVVESTLDGRVREVKESVIGIEVLGRDSSFDPRTDPIVRVEAGRLRARLGSYYQTEGNGDPVLIVLPKGGYVPEFSERQSPEPPQKTTHHPAVLLVAGALLGFAAAALALFYFRPTPDPGGLQRLSILPPRGAAIESSVISPDGRRIAFTAVSDGKKTLWVRDLDSLEPKALPGTDDASYPFWSPDSHSLGFFQPGKLKTIDISGGAAQPMCDTGIAFGGAWSSGGAIVLPLRLGPLYQVPASGGTPQPVTSLDPERAEYAHELPQFLPDNRHFLYYAVSSRQGESSIRVGSLDSTSSKFLLNADASAVYAPLPGGRQGFLLFVYRDALMAQRFDPQRLELSGGRAMVAPEFQNVVLGQAGVSASATGVLAYQNATHKNQQLAWFDRAGKPLKKVGPINDYTSWSLSPNEESVAIQENDPSRPGGSVIWIMDLARGVPSRLTDVLIGFTAVFFPIWSPDGSDILFSAGTDRAMSLQRQALNGRSSVKVLDTPGPKFASDWSSDGRFVAYYTPWPDFKKRGIRIMPMGGSNPQHDPPPFSPASYSEHSPYFAPASAKEGPRWIAYVSNETGREEVHVRNFPAGDRTRRVSERGGQLPHWGRDGRELFYLTPDGTLMVVKVKTNVLKDGAAFEFGPPQELFRTGVRSPAGPPEPPHNVYAVSRDGRRFLINGVVKEAPETPITIVTGWQAGLQ
jgi:Tol biopolymer transport system component